MSATRRVSSSKSATRRNLRRKRGGVRSNARNAMNATRPRSNSNPMNATRPNASAPPLSPLAIASAPPLSPLAIASAPPLSPLAIASAPPLYPDAINVYDLASAPPQLPEDIAPAQYQLMVHQVAMAAHNNHNSIRILRQEVEDIRNTLNMLVRFVPHEEV